MKKRKTTLSTRSAEITLSVYGEPVKVTAEVPLGPSTPRRMLPVFRRACGAVVAASVAQVARRGRDVSCAAGCGACCRQLVPISPTEAHLVADLVEHMPPERKAVIAERFAAASHALADAGLSDQLRGDEKPTGESYRDLGLNYFNLGIPCPFLENESCSIHPDRPLVCREYLVVSPPENCARTNGEPIEVIRIPGEASKALTALSGGRDFNNWVPLALALEWSKANPSGDSLRPGEEIARQFFGLLANSTQTT